MRNIIAFIRHFFNLFLFLILMGISIGILINYNQTYQVVFSDVANETTGKVGAQYNAVEYYFRLKKTNEALAAENAELRGLLKSSFEGPDTAKAIRVDSLLKDTLGRIRKFEFLTAKVVNNDISEQNNYITLYRGKNQGAQVDMGVIGPQGIVGKVILVSDNYCRVMSLLNRNSKVSAMTKKGFYTGLVDWDGKDPRYVIMHNVPKSAKVKAGDSIITSNLSGSYPPGIMIGTVAALQGDPASGFYELKIKTATDFYNIQYAYLVNNMIWAEQKQLEAKTPKDK
ncbi:rod shape-determining protein MreC [Parafilimonas sp.]|uniref:rod shape-determining protein MreC n=1 Tax=Parafilimonas sp. TaxID=1969739 RepID=UPI0039E25537